MKRTLPAVHAALMCVSLCIWLLMDTTEAVPPSSGVSVSVSDTDGQTMGIGRTSSATGRARRYPLSLTGRVRPDSRLRARFQVDPADLLLDDDDALLELNKRQVSDDYGHMRFGKRRAPGEFDDYGHMRFGRSNGVGGGGGDATD